MIAINCDSWHKNKAAEFVVPAALTKTYWRYAMSDSEYSSIIWLDKGFYSIVDNEDVDRLPKRSWYARILPANKYARCTVSYKVIYLHRFIMNAPKSMQVDHINGNGLDNRKSNLRVCTQAQNNMNVFHAKKPTATSRFKGVIAQRGKWRAEISINNKNKFLGYFECEIEAAKTYDAKAIELRGEFARTNKMMGLLDG